MVGVMTRNTIIFGSSRGGENTSIEPVPERETRRLATYGESHRLNHACGEISALEKLIWRAEGHIQHIKGQHLSFCAYGYSNGQGPQFIDPCIWGHRRGRDVKPPQECFRTSVQVVHWHARLTIRLRAALH